MQGHSMANFSLSVLPFTVGLVFVGIFGDPLGIKIAALMLIPFCAFNMCIFVRRLTQNDWTAVVAAILYCLSANMLVRIANFEHWMGSYAYIFPPLILWGFLKVADEGSWRASAWLAVGWSAMMLCYAKLAFMFAPLALVFFVWLLIDQPGRRVALMRGTLVSLVLVCLMAALLSLPLTREYQWVAAFSFDNFAGWQQAFSIKNFTSVLDRANGLFAQMLGHFEHQLLALVLHDERVQNLRQFAVEAHVDDGTGDLDNTADRVVRHVCCSWKNQTASAPEMISINSLVIEAWRERL